MALFSKKDPHNMPATPQPNPYLIHLLEDKVSLDRAMASAEQVATMFATGKPTDKYVQLVVDVALAHPISDSEIETLLQAAYGLDKITIGEVTTAFRIRDAQFN